MYYFSCIDILQVLFKKLSDEKFENCPFPIVLLSMLYEFVMATDLDKPTIKSLINLVIGNYLFSKKFKYI